MGLKERQKDSVVGLSYKKNEDFAYKKKDDMSYKKYDDLSYKKNEDKDELDVGVRGANRVSGLAEQLTQQLQVSWGMAPPATRNVLDKPVSILDYVICDVIQLNGLRLVCWE